MSTTTKTVTKRQAEAVLRAVKEKYKYYDTQYCKIIWDWNGDGHPYICWEECSPEDWACNFTSPVKGTFAEAYYSFVLGVFPDWD